MNLVVAVESCDFLDQIRFDGEVEAIRRWRDDEVVTVALRRQSKSGEYRTDLFGGNGDAKNSRNARAAYPNRIAPRKFAAHVDERTGAPAAQRQNQRGGAIDCVRRRLEIHTALEAIPGIGDETETPRLALDDRGIPERPLEQHAGRAHR